MDRRRIKFFSLGVGIVACMAFLMVVGMNRTDGFAYYLTVSEFLERPAADGGFRVNGKVTHGTIRRLPTGQDVLFEMNDGLRSLDVQYHGIIPDTFVDGADVVVEGRLQDDGTFAAHKLLAKCPSKYEAADGAEMPAVTYPGTEAG